MNPPLIVSWLLWPLSLVYGAWMMLRALAYRRGLFKSKRVEGMVISVGNLTTGGTGKTPTALWIALRAADVGQRSAILLRGYGSRGEAGLLTHGSQCIGGILPNRLQNGEVGHSINLLPD